MHAGDEDETPMDALAQTARWTAAARARESQRPDRLFEDPLAAVLAGEQGFALLDAEPPEARDNPYLAIRTYFFDDWLERVTRQEQVQQVVLVAAGMDSRAFRLRWPAELVLFEVDQPALLELKAELLSSTGFSSTCERRPVGVDLERDAWADRLRAAGFRDDTASVWLAEGFFEYLPAAAVESVLVATAALSAPGSRLGADFVSEDLLRSPWMTAYLSELERRGTPWRFGTNQPEHLLERYGWRADQVRQPGEEGAGAGRWPWPVAPRDVPGLPRSFLVTATRAT